MAGLASTVSPPFWCRERHQSHCIVPDRQEIEIMSAAIIGWAHLPFGKHDAETIESMVVKVANEALAHAGIAP
jgi:hypothetical protein